MLSKLADRCAPDITLPLQSTVSEGDAIMITFATTADCRSTATLNRNTIPRLTHAGIKAAALAAAALLVCAGSRAASRTEAVSGDATVQAVASASSLRLTASCRDNPGCLYDGRDVSVNIVITNAGSVNIGFPLAYLRERGPTVLLTDRTSKAAMPQRINLAPYHLRHAFHTIGPGESVVVDTVIHATALRRFASPTVDVSADISPAVDIQVDGQPAPVPFRDTVRLRIAAPGRTDEAL